MIYDVYTKQSFTIEEKCKWYKNVCAFLSYFYVFMKNDNVKGWKYITYSPSDTYINIPIP